MIRGHYGEDLWGHAGGCNPYFLVSLLTFHFLLPFKYNYMVDVCIPTIHAMW